MEHYQPLLKEDGSLRLEPESFIEFTLATEGLIKRIEALAEDPTFSTSQRSRAASVLLHEARFLLNMSDGAVKTSATRLYAEQEKIRIAMRKLGIRL